MNKSIVAQVVACLLGTTMLTGCNSAHVINQISADCMSADGRISADCASRHPSFGKTPSQYQRAVAYRNMLNEQVAAKQITKAQADFMQQEYGAKLENEMAAQNAASAAQSQAYRNTMMSTGAALIVAGQRQPAQPVYRPAPLIRTTNCNAMGSTMNCTSF